jgi:hypothetical protein
MTNPSKYKDYVIYNTKSGDPETMNFPMTAGEVVVLRENVPAGEPAAL